MAMKLDDLSDEEIKELRISLKEYFDARYDTLNERMETRFTSLQEALRIATIAMDARLAGMNEFRQSVNDQASNNVTRTEVNVWHDRIESEIRQIRETIITLVTRIELEGWQQKVQSQIDPLHDLQIALKSKASSQALIVSYIMSGILLFISIVNFVLAYSDRLTGK